MQKKKIHLISGTHWDREWRHTAEQSKLRLVDLMDSIINVLENNPEYTGYCVDGGTIVIEDYLSVRPENEKRIKKLIHDKKMFIVNWYTLPETNTVAPEALIRNLLLGHKMAKDFGGGIKSGYTATSYGQPSQLPQLYSGFNIPNAIFYRGTNKHVLTPLFNWKSPDGSSIKTLRTFDEVTRTNWFFYVHGPAVLGKGLKDLSYTYDPKQIPVHMADIYSYEKAFTLLKENPDYIHDPAVLKQSIDNLLTQAEPYKIGDHILALNMEDNDEPYGLLPDMLKDMNKIYPDVEIVQDTLDEYMNTISNIEDYEPATHEGELRYTTMEYNNFNALLGATHSSRIKIKLYNDDVENNLINLCEPLTSYASMFGMEYPTTNIERAWHYLLKNHAHDSICGAAVDRAHEDMMYNFSLAKTVAEECTNRSVTSLFSNINSKAYYLDTDITLTIFNTMPFDREEVIELIIDTPKKKKQATDIGVGGAAQGEEFYDIINKDGNIIPYHELVSDDISIGVECRIDTKAIKFAAKRKRVLVKVNIKANGYQTYALRFREPKLIHHPEIIGNRKLLARENGVLENDFIKVEIKSNGTFDIFNKKTNTYMKQQHYFTDSGEVGSAHISNIPKRNQIYTSLGSQAKITMLESNELRGKYQINLEMEIPAEATLDGTSRSYEFKKLPIKSILTLEKDSPYLKVKTTLTNEVRDHKLIVNFPSEIADANFAASESAWDIAKRTIKWRDHGDNFEGFFPFQPMQNFVDVSDGKHGFAFLNKGLREYEVADDAHRTLKITLIRTQRAYMTANGNMTHEELDQYTGQHSFGKLTYEYALYPHDGEWLSGEVLKKAYGFKVPLKAIQGVPTEGILPSEGQFIKFSETDRLMISALKQAESKNGYILRIWNVSDDDIKVNADTMLPITSMQRVNLNEDPIEDIKIKDQKFSFDLGKHKIYTIHFTTGKVNA